MSPLDFGLWCNSSTVAFEAACVGANPTGPAKRDADHEAWSYVTIRSG